MIRKEANVQQHVLRELRRIIEDSDVSLSLLYANSLYAKSSYDSLRAVLQKQPGVAPPDLSPCWLGQYLDLRQHYKRLEVRGPVELN